MLTDLAWARAARAAADAALAQLRAPPRAIIYSSTTAALLWPRPGAIRFDATSAGNRPGRHGLWQRPLERRRLARAPLLLPWSEGALSEAPSASSGRSSARAARAGRPSSLSARPSRRRATSPRSPTRRTRARRASTACSRRGGACVASCRRACHASCSSRARPKRSSSGPACRPARMAFASLGAAAAGRIPRAAAPRPRVRVRAAPRGLRHRPARGARRRLPAGDHARAWPVCGASARPRARPAARERRSRRARCAPRCPTRRRTTRRARPTRSCRSRARRSIAWSPSSYLRVCLPSFLQLLPRTRVGDIFAREPGAPRGGDAPEHVRECADAVGVGVDHERHSGTRGCPSMYIGEVAPVRVGVDLEHRAGAGGCGEDGVEVDRVGLAALDQPAGGVPDGVNSGCSIAAIMRSVMACSSMANDVCTLAITQSSSPSSASS